MLELNGRKNGMVALVQERNEVNLLFEEFTQQKSAVQFKGVARGKLLGRKQVRASNSCELEGHHLLTPHYPGLPST